MSAYAQPNKSRLRRLQRKHKLTMLRQQLAAMNAAAAASPSVAISTAPSMDEGKAQPESGLDSESQISADEEGWMGNHPTFEKQQQLSKWATAGLEDPSEHLRAIRTEGGVTHWRRRETFCGNIIMLTNLAPGTTKGDVIAAMDKYGNVWDIFVQSKVPPFFAFFAFYGREETEEVLEASGKILINGQKVNAELLESKEIVLPGY